MNTGILDKNNIMIKTGDKIKCTKYTWEGEDIPIYKIGYGIGSYDSGFYTYIGFHCTRLYEEDSIHDETDGNGWVLTCKSDNLEVIK